MKRKAYPSDLTDQQWALIEPLLPRLKRCRGPGRPREVDVREVVAVLTREIATPCAVISAEVPLQLSRAVLFVPSVNG